MVGLSNGRVVEASWCLMVAFGSRWQLSRHHGRVALEMEPNGRYLYPLPTAFHPQGLTRFRNPIITRLDEIHYQSNAQYVTNTEGMFSNLIVPLFTGNDN